ncbi:MAG: hypothetical protein GOV01_02055 [Candidatus Altiarchaeota archaeon]|nr:hypothetical protein [Candidatus Altiarchaeota archaeon]
MRLALVFLLLMPIVFATGLEVVTTSSEGMAVGITGDVAVETQAKMIENTGTCTVSTDFISQVKAKIMNEFDIAPMGYIEVSDQYCWEGENRRNINFNIIIKESKESIDGLRVGASFYMNEFQDFDAVFTEEEARKLGYTIKQMYIEFLSTGKSQEFYVSMYPKYGADNIRQGFPDCDGLKNVYNEWDGEKYLNDDGNYCELIVKTDISSIRGLTSNNIDYISYFGDEVNYMFGGYSEGSFDLDSLSKSVDCRLNEGDYYIMETSECHGIYKNEERFHMSANQEFEDTWVNFEVYGFQNGEGQIHVNINGVNVLEHEDEAKKFISETTEKFFGKALMPNLEVREMGQVNPMVDGNGKFMYLEGKAKLENLVFNQNALQEIDLIDDRMNEYYSDQNLYITIGKPYIQLFIGDGGIETIDAKMTNIYPGYQFNDIVITQDKVFARVALDENNQAKAILELKELTSRFVETDEWKVEMKVTRKNDYPVLMREPMMMEPMMDAAVSGTAVNWEEEKSKVMETRSQDFDSGEGLQIADEFSEEFPDFAEFDKEQVKSTVSEFINGIIDWLFAKRG